MRCSQSYWSSGTAPGGTLATKGKCRPIGRSLPLNPARIIQARYSSKSAINGSVPLNVMTSPSQRRFRTLEVRNRAAETAVVAGQPVELPGDPPRRRSVRPAASVSARHNPTDVRAEALERVDKFRPVALRIEGHVGGHTAKAGVLGVATERVGGYGRSLTVKPRIGPAAQTVSSTIATTTVARVDSPVTTLRPMLSTAASQSSE